MSSLYAAEQLSVKIAHSILRNLAELHRASLPRIKQLVFTDLQLEKDSQRNLVKQSLYRLQRSGYITRTDSSTQASLIMNHSGYMHLQKLDLKSITFTPKQWDGVWRILSYDIPEEHRPARDAVRNIIKTLGFVKIQRSMWVHPANCRPQIKLIKKAYHVDPRHITLIEATYLDQASSLKKKFKLTDF